MDLLQILIDCYNRNDFSNVLGVLSKDCSYASQWVFEEMQGSEKISEYLIAKTDTIAKYHAFPTAKKHVFFHLILEENALPCIKGISIIPPV